VSVSVDFRENTDPDAEGKKKKAEKPSDARSSRAAPGRAPRFAEKENFRLERFRDPR
jgi:hypothetical protein